MTTFPLQAKTTITSATAATGVDISGSTYGFVSGPTNDPPGSGFKIHVRIYGLDTGDDCAPILIQSSTDGFDTNIVTHATFWPPPGPIGATSDQGEEGASEGLSTAFPCNPIEYVVGLTDQLCSAIPWGTSGATLRVNISSLTGTSPHLTYEAWFTY